MWQYPCKTDWYCISYVHPLDVDAWTILKWSLTHLKRFWIWLDPFVFHCAVKYGLMHPIWGCLTCWVHPAWGCLTCIAHLLVKYGLVHPAWGCLTCVAYLVCTRVMWMHNCLNMILELSWRISNLIEPACFLLCCETWTGASHLRMSDLLGASCIRMSDLLGVFVLLLSLKTVLSSVVLLMLELLEILSLDTVLSSVVWLLPELLFICIPIPMRMTSLFCTFFIIARGALLVFLCSKILLNSSQSISLHLSMISFDSFMSCQFSFNLTTFFSWLIMSLPCDLLPSSFLFDFFCLSCHFVSIWQFSCHGWLLPPCNSCGLMTCCLSAFCLSFNSTLKKGISPPARPDLLLLGSNTHLASSWRMLKKCVAYGIKCIFGLRNIYRRWLNLSTQHMQTRSNTKKPRCWTHNGSTIRPPSHIFAAWWIISQSGGYQRWLPQTAYQPECVCDWVSTKWLW